MSRVSKAINEAKNDLDKVSGCGGVMEDYVVMLCTEIHERIKFINNHLREPENELDMTKERIESQIDFYLNYSPCDMQKGITYGMIDMAKANDLITSDEKEKYINQLENN